MTRSHTIAMSLSLAMTVSGVLLAAENPKPHWSQEAVSGKPSLKITVSTAELSENQLLMKASCEVAFFDSKGTKIRSAVFDVSTPIDGRTKKTQEFQYDPPLAASTKGVKMDYQLATRPYSAAYDPNEVVVTDGSVPPDK